MQPAVRNVQPEIDLMHERVRGRVVADKAASHGGRPKTAAVIADTNQAIQGMVKIWREGGFEKAGLKLVADVIRKMDSITGAAEFVQGPLKWDEKGRRVGAGLVIAQWRGGQPVAVHPSSTATHPAVWVGA